MEFKVFRLVTCKNDRGHFCVLAIVFGWHFAKMIAFIFVHFRFRSASGVAKRGICIDPAHFLGKYKAFKIRQNRLRGAFCLAIKVVPGGQIFLLEAFLEAGFS